MNKTILITGCSSGIGYDTAHYLHKHNYRVFATARSDSDVLRLQNEGLNTHQLDVCDSDSIDRALIWMLDQTDGEIYALFNNAGYGQPGALEDLSSEALRAQFETNVIGLHELTRRVLPIMHTQGYGRILQHSSVLGLISLRFRGAYNASKYAIEGLCDTLRLELRDTNVHVITLNTGPVRSKFRDNAITMFDRYVDAKNSRFKDQYESEVRGRKESKESKDPFTKNSNVVIDKVILALEKKHPAPRYYITTATHLLGTFKRLLPTSWLDAILIRI